jgi:hypothetical protein
MPSAHYVLKAWFLAHQLAHLVLFTALSVSRAFGDLNLFRVTVTNCFSADWYTQSMMLLIV